MLQKLENAYLGILRTVVIVASGILLVGVVMFGLSSLKGFGDGPSDDIKPPKVMSDEIVKKIVTPEVGENSQEPAEQAMGQEAITDPNKAYYDASATKILEFVARVSGGTENPDKNQVIQITKERAESTGSEELTAAYAKGFAESVDKVLSDKSIDSAAKKSSGLDVVNKLLNVYSEEFNAQLQAEHEKISLAKQEHMQAKAESSGNLYIAAGCFAMFLLIVFLSIFIKIERNLRHLEVNNTASA